MLAYLDRETQRALYVQARVAVHEKEAAARADAQAKEEAQREAAAARDEAELAAAIAADQGSGGASGPPTLATLRERQAVEARAAAEEAFLALQKKIMAELGVKEEDIAPIFDPSGGSRPHSAPHDSKKPGASSSLATSAMASSSSAIFLPTQTNTAAAAVAATGTGSMGSRGSPPAGTSGAAVGGSGAAAARTLASGGGAHASLSAGVPPPMSRAALQKPAAQAGPSAKKK